MLDLGGNATQDVVELQEGRDETISVITNLSDLSCSLNDDKNYVLSFCVVLVNCSVQSVDQMIPLVPVSVFLEIIAFLFADFRSRSYLWQGQSHGL